MTSFAKAQLLKYGWTEGKGLGKKENGAIEAPRPKIKNDRCGIGQESKEYKWWESVYDRAAANIRIHKLDESREIPMTVQDPNAGDVSTMGKINRNKMDSNAIYGNFRKTCTLVNDKLVTEEENVEKLDKAVDEPTEGTSLLGLTDEELFKACGGRTAHKGARHGLTLNGKLARIAMQEARLLGNGADTRITESNEWTEVKKKKKAKRKRRRSIAEIDSSSILGEPQLTIPVDANSNSIEESTSISNPEIVGRKSKKLKRKEKRNFEALTKSLDAFSLIDSSSSGNDKNSESENSTKKRKRKKCEIEDNKIGIESDCTKGAGGGGRKCKYRREGKFNDDKSSSPCTRPRQLATYKETTYDGNVITLDDNDDNDPDPDYLELGSEDVTELTKKRKKDWTEAERLNYRIEKRKKKCHSKNEKRRVERLSECLMAVNLCEDSVDSGRGDDLVESFHVSRKFKKWKKHRRIKKERKIEEIILDSSIAS